MSQSQKSHGVIAVPEISSKRQESHGVIAVPEISTHWISSGDQSSSSPPTGWESVNHSNPNQNNFFFYIYFGLWLFRCRFQTWWRSGKWRRWCGKRRRRGRRRRRRWRVVEAAGNAWKRTFLRSKVDDCTVACLFFQTKMNGNDVVSAAKSLPSQALASVSSLSFFIVTKYINK